MTLVLPGGRLLPRFIPSFCNVSFGELAEDWPLSKAIEAARTAMQRRNQQLTPNAEQMFRQLHMMTSSERTRAMAASTARQVGVHRCDDTPTELTR